MLKSDKDFSLWPHDLHGSVQDLQQKTLLRVQRPTLPQFSSAEALIHEQDLDAWATGNPPLPNSVTATAWREAVTAQQQCHARSSITSQHEYSQHKTLPTYAAGPFLLLPPSSVKNKYDARSSIVQAWEDGSRGSSASGAALNLPPSDSKQQVLQPPNHIPHSMSERTHSPASSLKRLKLFSLNDYLGLSAHPDVAAAVAAAVSMFGMGARSSGVVGGTSALHRELEEGLAALKGTQECLLCPTGFAANMAVLTALTSMGGRQVCIFSDALNHASIIDGARLACRSGSASLHVYRHNDMAHLEQLLQSLPSSALALVITDSLFSMDGDFADLQALASLRARYGFLLAVDEAHATLICGDRGAGAAEALGVSDQVDVHIGTLSKAFGALGGFVATSAVIKALVLNKGRAHVYSTALPIPVVSAAQTALAVSNREHWRRPAVWSLVERLSAGLGIPAVSPIVPLVVGGEAEAVGLASKLLKEHGMHVPAIRPPTVPKGTCRLRVSLSAAHTAADVDALIAAIQSSLETLDALSSHDGNVGGQLSAQSGNSQPRLMHLQYLEAQAHTPIALAMKPWRKTCM